MFLQIFHSHEWSEWSESYANKHPWNHAKTLDRYCPSCGEREYRVLELLCPQLKVKGRYCHWCLPYAEEWEKRGIDFTQFMEYDGRMETPTEKRKKKLGRPPMLARNIAMAIEHEFYGKTMREIGKEYGVKDPRTAWQAIHMGRNYMNLENVRKAVE